MKRVKLVSPTFWRRDERGTSSLEFAVVSLPLFLFMFGIMEFGRAIWIEQALESAAVRTARCIGLKVPQTSSCSATNVAACGCYDGSGNFSTANATTYAQYVAQNWGVTLASSNVSISNTATCNITGQTFGQAQVSYTFSPVISLIPLNKKLQQTACFPMNS